MRSRRKRRRQLLVAGAIVIAGVLALALAGNTFATMKGWSARPMPPGRVARLLEPGFDFRPPPGLEASERAPTALLFSGCDGPKDNLDRWSAALNAAGWAALVVDSHEPRGFDDYQRWRLICAGQVLPGGERAGEVAVAIDAARRMPGVDPDRLALIGASHGGWAVMDMLALYGSGEKPFNLRRWPTSIAERGFEGVKAVVLFYPYCGAGSVAARTGFEAQVPLLFLLVKDDAIADDAACLKLVDRLSAAGLPVETDVYEGVTHGFDQQQKSMISPLVFDAETTDAAMARMVSFLDRAIR